MMNMIRGAVCAGALALSITATTSAQGPVITGGLVNVTVTNALNNNEVVKNVNVSLGVALQLAANVCGVGVNVLASQLGSGQAVCTAPIDGTQQLVATITR